jgi:flagellar motility protein MotE (MotC chaperone)
MSFARSSVRNILRSISQVDAAGACPFARLASGVSRGADNAPARGRNPVLVAKPVLLALGLTLLFCTGTPVHAEKPDPTKPPTGIALPSKPLDLHPAALKKVASPHHHAKPAPKGAAAGAAGQPPALEPQPGAGPAAMAQAAGAQAASVQPASASAAPSAAKPAMAAPAAPAAPGAPGVPSPAAPSATGAPPASAPAPGKPAPLAPSGAAAAPAPAPPAPKVTPAASASADPPKAAAEAKPGIPLIVSMPAAAAEPKKAESKPLGPAPASAAAPQTEGQLYCASIAATAADARFAWQAKRLAELEAQLKQRISELDAKQAEYKTWLQKREDFQKKADDNVVAIYSKMRPEAAASQLTAMEDVMAAAILAKLNPRVASTILNEMDAAKAAHLTDAMSGQASASRNGKKS